MERLIRYTNANGASGDELEIRDMIKDEIKDHVDTLKIDHLGSLVAYKKGKDDSKRILLSAHMDEVALIVDKIDENGLIGIASIGGFLPKILPSKKVLIGKDRIPGATVLKSIHLMKPEEREAPISKRGISIDVGAKDKASCKVNIGDYVYFATQTRQQGHYLLGKAFDDRVGCAIITSILLRDDLPVSVYAHYCVQEEIGLRGGATAVFGKDDLYFGLNLEGTMANDRDMINDLSPTTDLGSGPAMTFMDGTIITHPGILKWAEGIAKSKGITYQYKRSVAGGTDAGAIYTSKAGLPVLNIAEPCRYIHSPVAIIDINDYESFKKLANALVDEALSFTY